MLIRYKNKIITTCLIRCSRTEMSIGGDVCINVLLTQGLPETKGPKEKNCVLLSTEQVVRLQPNSE